MGYSYPQTPLYRILVELSNVNVEKIPMITEQLNEKIAKLVGEDHHTILHVTVPDKRLPEHQTIRESFIHDAASSSIDISSIANTLGKSQLGHIYAYELLESFREVLLNNNVKEVLSLRDMVDGIQEYDLKMSQKNDTADEQEEEEESDDPYEEDYIFVPEFESTIEIGDDEATTGESFARWNDLFLEEQAAYRAKLMEGRTEEKLLPSGKQLFLQNMVANLFDEDDGTSSAFTFVKSERQADNEDDIVSAPETVEIEIDESLFTFDDDDDDDAADTAAVGGGNNESTKDETAPPAQQSTTTSETTGSEQLNSDAVSPTPPKNQKEEKREKAEKQSKHAHSHKEKEKDKDSKPPKDSKKDKKSEKEKDKDKKRDKKDAKGKAKKDEFDFGGGFSDFLGGDFDIGGDSSAQGKKKDKK